MIQISNVIEMLKLEMIIEVRFIGHDVNHTETQHWF